MKLKNISVMAIKEGAQAAGISLKPGQVISIDLSPKQIAELKKDSSLAIDDGADQEYDLSSVHVDATAPTDNAPKANGPMFGVGATEVTPPGAKGQKDDAASSDDKAKSSKK